MFLSLLGNGSVKMYLLSEGNGSVKTLPHNKNTRNNRKIFGRIVFYALRVI
jgi:hypothetical protein